MTSPIYTPMLKSKRGESKAIFNLDDSVKENIIPFFDVLALPAEATNGSDVQEHIVKQILNISSAWKNRGPCYVDLFDVIPSARALNGVHPARIAHSKLFSESVQAIPVVGIERDVAYKLSIRHVLQDGVEAIAVRLDTEDIQLPSSLPSRITQLISEIGATNLPLHVFMDFRSIEGVPTEILQQRVLRAVGELRKMSPARIVFAASAIVSNMGGFKRNTLNRVRRNDYLTWRAIAASHGDVDYADYGVVHPDYFDFDPRLIKPAAKIRYAADEQWVVIKGACWRDNTAQHHELSQMLMNTADFRGNDSWGGAYICSAASGRPKYGTLETWVTIDQNNHITQTVKQMSRVIVTA